MSTPQLIDVPNSCIANISLGIERKIGTTVSEFTYNSQTFKWPGERWILSFSLPNLVGRARAADWVAFGAALEGGYNCFLMGDPLGKVPRGVGSGTPAVNGGGQTGNTLVTDGWTPSTTGIMRKGDYIQLGTGLGATLHMLISDANSDGTGAANLNIVPAIRNSKSPADDSSVIINNAKGVFKLSQNTFAWSVSPGGIYRISFDAYEYINA